MARGFRPLGDIVNTSDRRGKGPVLRVLASGDGATCVMIRHFNPRRLPARLAGRDLRLCEAQTEFADGRFLETSNEEGLDVTTPPPQILRHALPPQTPPLAVLEAHELRKQDHELGAASACVPCVTLDDVLAARRRRHKHELAFRRQIGYADPDEVRKLALLEGSTEAAAEQLARAVDGIRKRQVRLRTETDG